MENKPKFNIANTIIKSRDDYTDGQLEALELIIKWYRSNDYSPFTLSGFAGTGKTTVIKDVVKNLATTIAITAPTHKAVRIASNLVGIEGRTVHSLLGLRPNLQLDDIDINNLQFDPLGNAYIDEYRLIIPDECSMIGDTDRKGHIGKGLFTLITKIALKHRVKVLFVGDPYQLPPVREKYSRTFNVKNRYNLTKIVRQAEGNSLINLLNVARGSVRNRSNSIINILEKRANTFDTSSNTGYAVADGAHFADVMNDKFDSAEFEGNIDFARYAAFTNNSVRGANTYVRNQLFGNDNRVLIHDDLLTSYNTIVDEFNAPIIINSEDYIINEIYDYNSKHLITGFLTKLRLVNGGAITNKLFVVDHTVKENLTRFVTIFYALLKATDTKNPMMRRDAWDKFHEFKNYNLLMVDVYRIGNEITLLKVPGATLVSRKSIDYGFGMTVHKTQGSTFSNILLNANNIVYNEKGIPYSDVNLRNRLLYVGLSRATDSAFIMY